MCLSEEDSEYITEPMAFAFSLLSIVSISWTGKLGQFYQGRVSSMIATNNQPYEEDYVSVVQYVMVSHVGAFVY